MKQALIVIDVQNDYFPGGAMELDGMETAAARCRQLLDYFRRTESPVIHMQHVMTRPEATFFLPDTFGCEINDAVKPLENERVVVKHFPSSFRETGLAGILIGAGIESLTICGAMTHMCIDTSVRAAFDLGYSVSVIHDACATRNLEFNGRVTQAADVQAAYMAALGAGFASVLSTQEFLQS